MDKRIKLIIEIVLFVLLLISISVLYNYLIQPNSDQSLKNVEKEETSQILEIKNIEQFKQQVLNENDIVFIDFYATWCMPCKTMSPIIEEIAKEHKDVKFVKVDIDENEELAIEYNIMSIPTMIIIQNGEIVKTFVGIKSKETIVNELEHLYKI